jgi:cellulose synthase/poly-beta-1,6-N-acetylglucosamine synthase-like glycosyltransferase
MDAAGTVFWGCLGLTVYAYAGYPLLLAAWSRMRGVPVGDFGEGEKEGDVLPKVSLIIPAYNEEQVIARKILNSLELDYPAHLLEIVVVSDGSSDSTEALARQTAGERVRLVFLEDRQGKTACINAVLPGLLGEIVVFTDANAFFLPDALRELVRPFRIPGIGCVMGELRYAQEGSLNSSLGEGLYWRYENFIKERESRLGSTIVGNGAIYAMRRAHCRILPREVEADVANPLLALSAGSRVIFLRTARCLERPAGTVREEFRRKTRIITNQITSYLYGWRDFRPLPPGAIFQIVSHKVLRWLVPFFLAGLLAASAARRGSLLLDGMLALQVLFYLAALAGWGLESGRRPVPRLLFLPYYFCAVNVASIKGMADFALGRHRVVWEKAASTR